jgi:hypothetical protein
MSDHDQASRETSARAALLKRLRMAAAAVHVQVDEGPATDISNLLVDAADYIAALSSPSPSVGWQDGARVKRTPDGWLVEIRHQDQSFTDIDVFEDGEIIVSEGGKDKRAHARTVREPSPPSPEPTPSDSFEWTEADLAQLRDIAPSKPEPQPEPTPEGRETVTLEQLRSIEWCHRVPGIGDTCPVCGGDGGHRHKFRRCWLGDAIERLAALTAPPQTGAPRILR